MIIANLSPVDFLCIIIYLHRRLFVWLNSILQEASCTVMGIFYYINIFQAEIDKQVETLFIKYIEFF